MNVDRRSPAHIGNPPRRLAVLSVVVVILSIGLFGSWSSYVLLDEAAVAPGKSDHEGLQLLESGIAQAQQAKEGGWPEPRDIRLCHTDLGSHRLTSPS